MNLTRIVLFLVLLLWKAVSQGKDAGMVYTVKQHGVSSPLQGCLHCCLLLNIGLLLFFKVYVWTSTHTSPICQEKAFSYLCGAIRILKPIIVLLFRSVIKYRKVHWRQISQRKFDLFFKPWKKIWSLCSQICSFHTAMYSVLVWSTLSHFAVQLFLPVLCKHCWLSELRLV